MREKVKIIRRHSNKYGYKIVVRGYIIDYFVKELEMLADDLKDSNTLETTQRLRDFKKLQWKNNGLIIHFKEYLRYIPKYEFDIEEDTGEERAFPSIHIEMKVRRSILRMLWKTYSC